MNLTLISPRILLNKKDWLGSGVPYWPVELAILGAFCRDRGETVSVLDLFGQSPRSLEDRGDHYLQGQSLREHLHTPAVTRAEAFIVYAMSYMSHGEILSIVEQLARVRPDAPIGVLENSQAVTGYDLSMVAGELFQHGASAVICGEPYWNWDAICQKLLRRGDAPACDNVITPNAPADVTVQRQWLKCPSYPAPAWDLFPLDNYWALPYSHGPKTRRFFPMLTSRGCPMGCDFCVVPATNSRHWRARAAEEVVDEMISLRDRFGVRDFQIEDLNATIDTQRWDNICSQLIEREAGVRFYFVSGTKAETVPLDQVPRLAQAGCRYLSISPESGSQRLLERMQKQFDFDHGLALLHACRANGIRTQACLLVGYPNETDEDHAASGRYLRQMVQAGLDEVAVFIVTPVAGSDIYRDNALGLEASSGLLTFGPAGRPEYDRLMRQRGELVRIFLTEKLKRGLGLWGQGLRALFGRPQTKLENLPRRILYTWYLIARNRWRFRP